MTNSKKILTVAKVNFKCGTWIAYIATLAALLGGIASFITGRIFPDESNLVIAPSVYLYLLCLCAPVFIPALNFSKLMNIGGRKKDFLIGSAINYIVFAALVSLLCTLEYYTIDIPMNTGDPEICHLIDVFGWDENILSVFFCQFAFLILVESTVHTLTFIQTRLYGWITSAVLIAIISVFTPIPVLRGAEVFFFKLIIFLDPAIAQIGICLGLAAAIYLSNLYHLKKRMPNMM